MVEPAHLAIKNLASDFNFVYVLIALKNSRRARLLFFNVDLIYCL